jgi:hypothetical protein
MTVRPRARTSSQLLLCVASRVTHGGWWWCREHLVDDCFSSDFKALDILGRNTISAVRRAIKTGKGCELHKCEGWGGALGEKAVNGVHHDADDTMNENKIQKQNRVLSAATRAAADLLMSSDAPTNAISSCPSPTTNLPAGVDVCAS